MKIPYDEDKTDSFKEQKEPKEQQPLRTDEDAFRKSRQ
jgi:hypothetical protein